MPDKVGYVRVSTQEQNTDRQLAAMKEHGVQKLFAEKISGKNANRPQLQEMLRYVREGDTVYIESISRLARNTADFLHIVDQLQKEKVRLVSLKENIDTSTPQGKFMLTVFGALAELEKETTRQRQREGIDIALAQGRAYGRPKIEVDGRFMSLYRQWKADKVTAVDAMKQLGMTRSTFYRRVSEIEGMAK
ncbi:MAG: recombinase family protein [Negativicutes bacterium]|nr:recombinase family protein [Negativicutes bacterium]